MINDRLDVQKLPKFTPNSIKPQSFVSIRADFVTPIRLRETTNLQRYCEDSECQFL